MEWCLELVFRGCGQTVDGDLQRLKRTSTSSAEYSSLRSYLEAVAELPWAVSSTERTDLTAAEVRRRGLLTHSN